MRSVPVRCQQPVELALREQDSALEAVEAQLQQGLDLAVDGPGVVGVLAGVQVLQQVAWRGWCWRGRRGGPASADRRGMKVKSTVIWAAPSAISSLARCRSRCSCRTGPRVIASRMVDLPAPVSPRMAMLDLPVKSSGPTAPGVAADAGEAIAAAVSFLRPLSLGGARFGCRLQRDQQPGLFQRPPGSAPGRPSAGPPPGRSPGTSLAASASRPVKVARMSPATAPAGTWPGRYSRNRSGRSGSSPSARRPAPGRRPGMPRSAGRRSRMWPAGRRLWLPRRDSGSAGR